MKRYFFLVVINIFFVSILSAQTVIKTPQYSESSFSVLLSADIASVFNPYPETHPDIDYTADMFSGTVSINFTGTNQQCANFDSVNVVNPGVIFTGNTTWNSIESNSTGKSFIRIKSACLEKTVLLPFFFKITDVSWKPGTLGYHVENTMSSLIDGVTAIDSTKQIFVVSDPYNPIQWNTGCWAYPVDITSMSVWRDTEAPNRFPVVAITPFDVVSGHVGMATGIVYRWLTRDNVVVERTIVQSRAIGSFGDASTYYVGRLNAALPAGITPAKLLDFGEIAHVIPSACIPSSPLTKLPVIVTDQDKNALISVSTLIGSSTCGSSVTLQDAISSGKLVTTLPDVQLQDDKVTRRIVVNQPESGSQYLAFYEEIVPGDSSSPIYLVVNNEAVLLTTLYTSTGEGASYESMIWHISRALEQLHGGVTSYYPEIVDLSSFAHFD